MAVFIEIWFQFWNSINKISFHEAFFPTTHHICLEENLLALGFFSYIEKQFKEGNPFYA